MSLILAVEPDRRRAAQLSAMARAHLDAEFVLAHSVAQGFQALGERVPDVLLMAPLLPPAEESALDDYLRLIGPAASHVQSLTIPLLAGSAAGGERSLMSVFRRGKPAGVDAGGCEPALFADQIATYMREARARSPQAAREELPADPPVTEPPAVQEVDDERVIDLSPLLEEVAAFEEEQAILADEPIVIDEPILIDEPVSIEAPMLVEAPVVVEEPVSVLEPVVMPRLEVLRLPEPPAPPTVSEPELLPAVEPLAAAPPARIAAPPQHQLVPFAGSEPLPAPALLAPFPAPQPNTVQQIIQVPTGNGTHAHASVNVAVAVSVQVAASVTVAAPAPAKRRKPRPVQDEWGFFDPGQCGFQALIARLDEIAAKEDGEDA